MTKQKTDWRKKQQWSSASIYISSRLKLSLGVSSSPKLAAVTYSVT